MFLLCLTFITLAHGAAIKRDVGAGGYQAGAELLAPKYVRDLYHSYTEVPYSSILFNTIRSFENVDQQKGTH